MSKLVTIFGGSGFVGRYVAQRLAHQGWRVRVVTRRPDEALFVKPYGNVGQVVPVFGNIRDDASVRAAIHGADAVVNCVGTFDAKGKNNFEAVQVDGAGRVARIAAEEGVSHLVHISALGADAEGESEYARTKAKGEAAVLAAMPGAMILRPSIIFGNEDQFFNRFADMAKFTPVLPLVGAGTRFQPVWVDDVAAAAVLGATGAAPGGIYELGGPHVGTFAEWIKDMLAVIRRRRGLFGMPNWLARIAATLTLGMVITKDQIKQLGNDNVVSGSEKGFADLGIEPVSVEAVLPDYLWHFRPSGQYAAIKDSAKNLNF